MVIPSIVQIGFGCTVVFVLFAYLVTFHRVDTYRKKFRHFLLVWLALTGILGIRHFFEDFQTMPPRVPLFIFIFSLSLAALAYWMHKQNALARVQQFHLILFQGFRIPVEILLGMLAQASLLPIEMSFHGRNFDMLIGITALPLAYWVRKKGEKATKNILLAWNILGLLMVSNVVIHGMLSAPYPFQAMKLSMDNFIIGYFPVVWLPVFLVPTAYFFHIISLMNWKARTQSS
ncbi:MAG: hypothetical protein EOO48_14110 [Flavobacterium sp.]|nr:MAG: hypothetical protein EOO48_14110 [Flavobacterium sp.]